LSHQFKLQSLFFDLFTWDSLTEAGIALSAARFSRMTATVLPSYQFAPIVAAQQADFLGPGLGTYQIGEKGPEIWTRSFLTHKFFQPL
jgi:hypothetical protein